MTQWEYLEETWANPNPVPLLNELGKAGWEVYHVEHGVVSTTFYMKRPVPLQIRGSASPKPAHPKSEHVGLEHD